MLDSGERHTVGTGGMKVWESSSVHGWELKSQKWVKLPSGSRREEEETNNEMLGTVSGRTGRGAGAGKETETVPSESLEKSGRRGKVCGESEGVLSSMIINYKRNKSKS